MNVHRTAARTGRCGNKACEHIWTQGAESGGSPHTFPLLSSLKLPKFVQRTA
jgi:hypothetical protein